jgi:hypothetical protein
MLGTSAWDHTVGSGSRTCGFLCTVEATLENICPREVLDVGDGNRLHQEIHSNTY